MRVRALVRLVVSELTCFVHVFCAQNDVRLIYKKIEEGADVNFEVGAVQS